MRNNNCEMRNVKCVIRNQEQGMGINEKRKIISDKWQHRMRREKGEIRNE